MADPMINLLSTNSLIAMTEEIVPRQTFFRDRYFPTGEGDIFTTDEVLTEYQKGNRKMAAFVSDRVGDIPIDRLGFSIRAYRPARVAPSRVLYADELNKRGFGEALYSNLTPAQRAARMQLKDLTELDEAITRREEWMAVQVMINNACTMQTYIDGEQKGDVKYVRFYETTSDHTYTVASDKKWGEVGANIRGDVKAMCDMLTTRGLPAEDLLLGPDAYDALLSDETIVSLLKKDSGVDVGSVRETIKYPGIVYAGKLNFLGNELSVFVVNETYVDEDEETKPFFPVDAALVTAPNCGHLLYGAVTQINFGDDKFSTIAGKRVPKLVVDQENDIRKIRLTARPLASPVAYCPYVFAAEVC